MVLEPEPVLMARQGLVSRAQRASGPQIRSSRRRAGNAALLKEGPGAGDTGCGTSRGVGRSACASPLSNLLHRSPHVADDQPNVV